ncbi:MAG: Rieske (2Fe-2S) protein [Flavobacteriia bacterium]|nr:Rieske (2Fe-2S) protein [Flavobacteriia bacterium]
MNRKEFIRSCAFACAKGVAIATLFQSCGHTKTVHGTIKDSDILIDLKDFEIIKNGKITYRNHIIIQNEIIQFPICIFRNSPTEYKAIYLKCSHQGAELQVFGDRLHCPAHGAEFNNKGEVEFGPAESSLRVFPYQIINSQLVISLR